MSKHDNKIQYPENERKSDEDVKKYLKVLEEQLKEILIVEEENKEKYPINQYGFILEEKINLLKWALGEEDT